MFKRIHLYGTFKVVQTWRFLRDLRDLSYRDDISGFSLYWPGASQGIRPNNYRLETVVPRDQLKWVLPPCCISQSLYKNKRLYGGVYNNPVQVYRLICNFDPLKSSRLTVSVVFLRIYRVVHGKLTVMKITIAPLILNKNMELLYFYRF